MEIIISRDNDGFRLSKEITKQLFIADKNKYYELFENDFFNKDIDILPNWSCEKDEKGVWLFCAANRDLRFDPLVIYLINQHHDTVPFLKIVNVPDDIDFDIVENDFGVEYIVEKHRIWY